MGYVLRHNITYLSDTDTEKSRYTPGHAPLFSMLDNNQTNNDKKKKIYTYHYVQSEHKPQEKQTLRIDINV